MSTETRDALRPSRVYQCPGCWSYGPAPRGDIECDCGERMENIDLRDAALRSTDVPSGLREAVEDVALWLEAEADHPRANPRPGMRLQAKQLRAALRATDVPSDSELDHIAWAQHVRAEHEATHGEAEMCGAECIVLGLTDFDDEDGPRATDVRG
jgi:hypothetical protein